MGFNCSYMNMDVRLRILFHSALFVPVLILKMDSSFGMTSTEILMPKIYLQSRNRSTEIRHARKTTRTDTAQDNHFRFVDGLIRLNKSGGTNESGKYKI